VVQRVIGPLLVVIDLDSATDVPAEVVIRPADLTKIPPTPAFRFALMLVAAVPVVVVEIAFDAAISPPTVIGPAAESVTFLAETAPEPVVIVEVPPETSKSRAAVIVEAEPAKVVDGENLISALFVVVI
jgi:hypothetical protein